MGITLDIRELPIGGTQGPLQGTNLTGEHTTPSFIFNYFFNWFNLIMGSGMRMFQILLLASGRSCPILG